MCLRFCRSRLLAPVFWKNALLGEKMYKTKRTTLISLVLGILLSLTSTSLARTTVPTSNESTDQILEWNQIFIDTLIATNTANSSSQRLGAIVHTSIFDAFNGIQRRYTPIFVQNSAPA